MKKILMIGAGDEQIIAIQQAKNLGFYVIVLDENPNAKGILFANKFITTPLFDPKELKNMWADMHGIHPVKLFFSEKSGSSCPNIVTVWTVL